MINENEKELFTLLYEFCDPSAQLSIKKLHQIDLLLGSKRGDECVSQLMQRGWEEDSEDFGKENYERIFDRVKQQMETSQSKRLSFMHFFQRIAAILLLPLLGLSSYFLVQTITSNQTTDTKLSEQTVATLDFALPAVVLSDGTTVTLQEGSRLNQKNDFNGNTREVTLEGEGFFDIAHNPDKPFIVHAKGIKTTALGTVFTVKAMPGETSITVTVVEGKVKVEEGAKLLTTLEANQQFIYGIEIELSHEKMAEAEKVEVVVEKEVEKEKEINWQPYDLIFRNMPFSDIVRELAVKHSVNIVVENEELRRRRISTLLDNRNPIEMLLELLCTSQQAAYTVQGNTYVIK